MEHILLLRNIRFEFPAPNATIALERKFRERRESGASIGVSSFSALLPAARYKHAGQWMMIGPVVGITLGEVFTGQKRIRA